MKRKVVSGLRENNHQDIYLCSVFRFKLKINSRLDFTLTIMQYLICALSATLPLGSRSKKISVPLPYIKRYFSDGHEQLATAVFTSLMLWPKTQVLFF